MAIDPGGRLAWERLGDTLTERRVELHYRNRRAFCDERQIDYRLIFDIEKHRRTNFAKPTMLDIARAYAVTPDSIDRLLHGQGDLEPLPEAPPAAQTPEPGPATTVPLAVTTAVGALVAPVISDVWAQVNRARMRRPNATGPGIFPDPHEAAIWDLQTMPEPDRIEWIAWMRVRRPSASPGEEAGYPPRRVQLRPAPASPWPQP